jgi:hypothetical protein
MARSYDPEPEAVIDHTAPDPAPPEPLPVVAPDDAARLRELRLKAAGMGGTLDDGEKAELDKLALAEADAAGHPEPVEMTGPAMEPGHVLLADILAVLAHLVATVPAAGGIAPRLAAMRQRLADLISPPADKK